MRNDSIHQGSYVIVNDLFSDVKGALGRVLYATDKVALVKINSKEEKSFLIDKLVLVG